MSRETAETERKQKVGFSEPIVLRIPSRSEYVLLTRLVVAQVGQLADFEPEDIYDLKLAVTEAVTNVIRHAAVEHFDIEYRVARQAVEITVTDAGGGFDAEDLTHAPDEQGGFGLAVIKNLVDEIALDTAAGGGTRLKMIRRATTLV